MSLSFSSCPAAFALGLPGIPLEVQRDQELPRPLEQMRIVAATTKAINKKDVHVLVDDMVKKK